MGKANNKKVLITEVMGDWRDHFTEGKIYDLDVDKCCIVGDHKTWCSNGRIYHHSLLDGFRVGYPNNYIKAELVEENSVEVTILNYHLQSKNFCSDVNKHSFTINETAYFNYEIDELLELLTEIKSTISKIIRRKI